MVKVTSRNPWKNSLADFISLSVCSYVVDNGRVTFFWEDKLLRDSPLCSLFPSYISSPHRSITELLRFFLIMRAPLLYFGSFSL